MKETATSTFLSQRLASASAYQMFERAQGYFEITDYETTVELSWFSDRDRSWSCALKYGPEEDELSSQYSFEVESDDVPSLENLLAEEISSQLI